MRKIDGDEVVKILDHEMEKTKTSAEKKMIGRVFKEVMALPTISRPKLQWKHTTWDLWNGMTADVLVCPHCNSTAHERTNFCSYCGCDLRG